MNIQRYESSGGTSAIIDFEGGERLRVEAHEESFGLTWTSDVNSNEIPAIVKDLLPVALDDDLSWVITGERGEKHVKVPTSKALSMLEEEGDVRFTRIEARDTVFTWRAAIDDKGPEIGYGCEKFYQERIQALIGRTAVGEIKEHAMPQVTSFVDKYRPAN